MHIPSAIAVPTLMSLTTNIWREVQKGVGKQTPDNLTKPFLLVFFSVVALLLTIIAG